MKDKLTYKERMELASLERAIEALEAERSGIEEALGSGTISGEAARERSERFARLLEEIEEKTNRWIELSEKE